MKSPLAEHIRKFIALNEAEEKILLSRVNLLSLKKKEVILKEGQICNDNYFVAKGCLRLFFMNDKGIEQTTQFAIENWWMSDNMSFIDQRPSTFYIQAVERSEIFSLNKKAQEQLFKELPQLEKYFRIIFQKAYATAQFRIKYLYNLSKEDNYRFFASSYPEFVQRIPQYMLASYLNLTPEYLSEIRKKHS
ncbi:MAG: Crp/Fnr family transcriptional regulator [Bacteroidia bacterium]